MSAEPTKPTGLTELTVVTGPEALLMQVPRLSYDLLFPSPTNPRRHFEEGPLDELSSNIEEHGILMPLMVRYVERGKGINGYEVVAGERRYRALGKALQRLAESGQEEKYQQLYHVPVTVRELTNGQVLALQLIENLQRKDLTPLEEAEGYQRLLDLPGDEAHTPKMIAQKIGIDVQTVLNKLNMLRAPDFMRQALEAGECSERHLVIVATIPREDARAKAAKKILAGDQWNKPLTVHDSVVLVNDEFRRSLKGVLFDLDDAGLVADAGACSVCPHFAKHAATMDSELAEELGNGRGKLEPLTCLLPSCFKGKQEAILKRKQEAAKEMAVELKVLKPEEAKKIFNNPRTSEASLSYRSGMVKLDDALGSDIYGHYNYEKMATWREATEGLLPVGAVVVAKMEDGSLVEIVEEKVAKASAKQHKKYGKLFTKEAKPELNAEQQRAKEREAFERRQKEHSRMIILDLIDEKAATMGMDDESMLMVLNVALMNAGSDGCKLLATWLKLEVKAPEGMQMNQTHVREAILEHLAARGSSKAELDRLVLMAILSSWIKIYGVDFDGLAPVEKRLGFDSKTVMALAKSAVQAEDAAKKAKAKAKPVKDTEQINAELKTKAVIAEGDEQREKAPSRGVDGPIMEAAKRGMPPVTSKRSKLGMWPVEDDEPSAAEFDAAAKAESVSHGADLKELVILGKDCAVAVLHQLKVLNVPGQKKNESGVFEHPSAVQCVVWRSDFKAEVEFVILLARDEEGWFSRAVEYNVGRGTAVGSCSGGGLPKDGHMFATRSGAIAEAVRDLVSIFKADIGPKKLTADVVKAREFLAELKSLADAEYAADVAVPEKKDPQPSEKPKRPKGQRAGESDEDFRKREAARVAAYKEAKKAKKAA